jgi:hypothetical protein
MMIATAWRTQTMYMVILYPKCETSGSKTIVPTILPAQTTAKDPCQLGAALATFRPRMGLMLKRHLRHTRVHGRLAIGGKRLLPFDRLPKMVQERREGLQ